MQSRIRTIYMVGIGGSGMNGIAEILLNLGYTVHGSDLNDSAVIARLRSLGATIALGHDAANVSGANVLVKSTAIKADNPEVMAAKELGIAIIPRAEMLAELMRLKTSIAIAGMHGKTTTTSFTASIFDEAGLDPTVIIGGRLNAYGANARLGSGKYLIAEADESDGSFLCLFSIVNAVTNIDFEHVDHYKTLGGIDDAFVNFMNKIPFYGLNVVCGDDPGVRRVLPRITRAVTTYGFRPDNDIVASGIACSDTSKFTVSLKGKPVASVRLSQPGQHNVLNALAAIGIGLHAGIPIDVCVSGLEKFKGVARRFERKGERGGVLVVDDYGHHPAELKATLETAQQCYPDRRIVVAFQPHRFSRTKALFGDFCKVFKGVDKLLLAEIYPASEDPIPGISSESLAQGIRQMTPNTDVTFYRNFDEISAALPSILKPGDLLLTLGAGSVYLIGQQWLEKKE